jgi:hypothetical protein
LRFAITLASMVLTSAVSSTGVACAQYMGNASPVGWPRLHFRNGDTHMAGKVFAIQWFHNKTLLICPLHLASPEAEYSHYVDAKDIPEELTSIDVFDLTEKNIVATTGPGLLRSGWTVGRARGDISGDMMAFEIKPGSKMPLLALCPTLVPVGTKVWVLSKNQPPTSNEPDRFSGTVSRSLPTGTTVNLNGPLTAQSSSGSAVVNAKGELVCMMVGKQDATRMVIMGIPSTAIYARLMHELKP